MSYSKRFLKINRLTSKKYYCHCVINIWFIVNVSCNIIVYAMETSNTVLLAYETAADRHDDGATAVRFAQKKLFIFIFTRSNPISYIIVSMFCFEQYRTDYNLIVNIDRIDGYHDGNPSKSVARISQTIRRRSGVKSQDVRRTFSKNVFIFYNDIHRYALFGRSVIRVCFKSPVFIYEHRFQ